MRLDVSQKVFLHLLYIIPFICIFTYLDASGHIQEGFM